MTPVIPSTKTASSRIAKAGVDTGEKSVGVGIAALIYTKAPNPVIALPTIRVFISRVPS